MLERISHGRDLHQLRSLSLQTGINCHAEGSVLIRAGNTHVLCTASVEETVPNWLAGKGKGWVTAEYSMLPRSTHTRMRRERDKVSGRTQEIQRLIGRALRACVDLNQLGERSILIDCDVIQADGGTRTASVTGGCVALGLAIQKLIHDKKIPPTAWVDTVAAISIGIKSGEVLVDLDYAEDSTCDVDMNFVMTGKGLFIEVQGTAEKKAFSKTDLINMTNSAEEALKQIQDIQLSALKEGLK